VVSLWTRTHQRSNWREGRGNGETCGAVRAVRAVPIAFVFNLLLERFITGFTMGAVKG
jgi:hypothetical protein